MSGPAEAGNPALALVLALFMAGYILWTTDQLASLSKAQGRRTRPQAGRGRPARAQAGKCRAGPGTPVRRLLQDRDERCHGIHARHDDL